MSPDPSHDNRVRTCTARAPQAMMVLNRRPAAMGPMMFVDKQDPCLAIGQAATQSRV